MIPTFHDAIGAIDADDWNRLAGTDWPFLRHEFLHALESSACVAERTGWQPCHLTLCDEKGIIRAAMPLYRKFHSWGEFVFDWSWADAYRRHGLEYYPKLVSATPFTPATSPRLLTDDSGDTGFLQRALVGAARDYARESDISSLHFLFTTRAESALVEGMDFLRRTDCQFHWRNHGYRDFDDFLAALSSSKRKKIRRERRRMREAGINFVIVPGEQMSETQWADAYRLCGTTFLRRGNQPYLNLEFYHRVAALLPGAFQIVFAHTGARPIAAAILFRGADTLYGRYWGSEADYHSLHFETCYYQGIDYCIREGLSLFEPGTQGEHKISRGFSAAETYSAHWLADPRFSTAIAEHLRDERAYIDEYARAVTRHSPYRRDR